MTRTSSIPEELLSTINELLEELRSILKEIKEPTEDTNKGDDKEEVHLTNSLSLKGFKEIASHEGAVLEAYKDSKGIWTWGVGVTNKSGHKVERYIDNPQPLTRVVEIYDWLVRTKYLPDVLETFKGFDLTEEQIAAATSFHYNTGGIKKASWVKLWKQGKTSQAKAAFMNWKKPPEIIPRRKKERDLFFNGTWSGDGKVMVYHQVNKPSYTPKWSSGKREEIL